MFLSPLHVLATPELDILRPGDTLCYKVTNNRVKARVAQRDDALLTPQELKDNWKQVVEAMDKELRTWVKLECVSRKPKADARNVIDARWVSGNGIKKQQVFILNFHKLQPKCNE